MLTRGYVVTWEALCASQQWLHACDDLEQWFMASCLFLIAKPMLDEKRFSGTPVEFLFSSTVV